MEKLLSQKTPQECAKMINHAFFGGRSVIQAQALKTKESMFVFEDLHFFICPYNKIKSHEPLCLEWNKAEKKERGLYLGQACTHLQVYEKQLQKYHLFLCMANQDSILSIFPLDLLEM